MAANSGTGVTLLAGNIILTMLTLALACEQTLDGTLEDSNPPPMRRQAVDLTRPVVTKTEDNNPIQDAAIQRNDEYNSIGGLESHDS